MLRKRLSLGIVLSAAGFFASSCGKMAQLDSADEQTYRLGETEVVKRGNYVYFITQLKDFAMSEQVEALSTAKDQVMRRLEEVYPTGKEVDYSDVLTEVKEGKLKEIVDSSQKWLKENKDGVADLNLNLSTLLPSAYMLTFGGKITGNLGIGAGGFVSVALILDPVKVTRIHKVTKEVVESFRFRWSAAGFPGINLGGGAGGGASLRAGVGFIWGDLVNPRHFAGAAGGLTGNLSASIGHNFSIGVLKQSKSNRTNLFAMAQWQAGGEVEASIHAFGGMVMSLDDYLHSLGFSDKIVPTEDPKANEMQWRSPSDEDSADKKIAALRRAGILQ